MKIKTFDYNSLGKIFNAKGYESTIVNYKNEDGEWELFKYFRNDLDKKSDNNKTIEEILKNKENKIKLLSEVNDERLVKVKDLVYENDKFIGYTMDIINGKVFDSLGSTRKEKIDYLEQIKETMLRLNEKGIYIGDYKVGNFLIDDNNKVFNVDIDNYKIGNYDFDTMATAMREFRMISDDETLVDRYCFNAFAIAILGRYAQGYFCIRNAELPFSFRTKYNKEVLYDMHSRKEEYKGKLLELKKTTK